MANLSGYKLQIKRHFYGNPDKQFPAPSWSNVVNEAFQVIVWPDAASADAEIEQRNAMQITLAHNEAVMPDYRRVPYTGDGITAADEYDPANMI
jgi:hypothetical protein